MTLKTSAIDHVKQPIPNNTVNANLSERAFLYMLSKIKKHANNVPVRDTKSDNKYNSKNLLAK